MDFKVVKQGDLTPKALARCSPGLELATTLGLKIEIGLNPERVRRGVKPFQGITTLFVIYQGSRMLEPWAEGSQRLRRIQNCITIEAAY
jgi:hypothetical protein